MRPPKDSGIRRATADDIGRIVGAVPSVAWHAEDVPHEGLHFDLVRSVDVERLAALRGAPRLPPNVLRGAGNSRVRVTAAGPFVRTEWSEMGVGKPDSALMEHAGRGAVLLDLAACTHLHLGPEQIPLDEAPGHERTLKADWRIREGKGRAERERRSVRTLIVEASKPVQVRWEVDILEDETFLPYAAVALERLVGSPTLLRRSSFPFDAIAKLGLPVRAATWTAMILQTCETKVSDVEIIDPGLVDPVDGGDFDIPAGSIDLRDQDARERTRESRPAAGKRGAAKRTRPSPRGTIQAQPSAHSRTRAGARGAAAYAYAYVASRPALGTPVLPGLTAEPEITGDGAVIFPAEPEVPLPQCLPSTQRVGSACDIRQFLLDHVSFLVNAAGERLTTLGGSRTDPNATDVTIAFDWLQALRDDHQALIDAGGDGDGLFCILRDEPSPDDPTSGGAGLLDRFAAAQAAALMETGDPLAGDDTHAPLILRPEAAAAIAAIVADETIAPEARFNALSLAVRAALREAVLTQWIGRFTTAFDGDSGVQTLPSADWDLLHVRFQLEDFSLAFISDHNTPLESLAIRGDPPAQFIHFDLHFSGFDATFSHTREPGEDFWITAAGVLVASLVILPAAAAVVIGLAALGGPGVVIVASLLTGLATPVALTLLAVTTFVLWENATIAASVGDFHLTTDLRWNFASDRDALVPSVDELTLDGPLTIVSYDSQIPSGIHQILGWFTQSLVNIFDLARGEVQRTLSGQITHALASLPHLRLPTPQDLRLDGDAIVAHQVVGGALDGAPDARLAVQALTDITVLPRNAGLLVTQGDRNALPALAGVLDAYEADSGQPYGGYGLSQNLLNCYAYATWAAGTFAENLDDLEAAVFAALGPLGEKCAAAEKRELHVWPASPPRVLLTPYAFAADPRKSYLIGIFDDFRICVGCPEGTLEVKFGVRLPAHLGLGRVPAGGNVLSLFTVSDRFANVYYDLCPDAIRVEPVETQSMSGTGDFVAALDSLDDAGRVAMLDALQGFFRTATARSLNDMRAALLPFEDPAARFDRHVYDGILVAQLTPARTGLYVAIAPIDRLRGVLPDVNGDISIDIASMTCGEARQWLPVLGGG